MKTIINTSTNPYFNLALEEYLLKEKDIHDDVFYVWRNDPCVVIGRNQNPFNEVHIDYANTHNIPIIRRMSGGGTVYHDLGNINFTYITTKVSERLNNYKFFVLPIVDILQSVGLDARFVESSHIYLGPTKISGNAQSFHKNKIIHHGTLLFDSDLDTLERVIKTNKSYETHAVDSTRAQTTNIKQALQVQADIEEFMEFIRSQMFVEDYTNHIIELTEKDIQNIENVSQSKYQSWQWNIGETPEFWINEIIQGEIVQLKVAKGIVTESSIYPDIIEGNRFDEQELLRALSDFEHGQTIMKTLFQ